MYNREKCVLCGDCLVACQNNNYDRKTAIEEMTALNEGRPANILKLCISCMGCIEVCKKGADPFDLICRMQEETNAIEEKGAYLPMLQQAKKMPGEIEKGKPGSKAISLCFIEQSFPRGLENSLFDGLTRIKGGPYHCLTGWLRIGMPGQVERGIRPFVENLATSGEKEIIFIHPGCYATATVLAKEYEIEVPFRPVHIFEYLLDQMAIRKDEIRKIDMKIAYHRPCASRLNPEMEPLLKAL